MTPWTGSGCCAAALLGSPCLSNDIHPSTALAWAMQLPEELFLALLHSDPGTDCCKWAAIRLIPRHSTAQAKTARWWSHGVSGQVSTGCRNCSSQSQPEQCRARGCAGERLEVGVRRKMSHSLGFFIIVRICFVSLTQVIVSGLWSPVLLVPLACPQSWVLSLFLLKDREVQVPLLLLQERVYLTPCLENPQFFPQMQGLPRSTAWGTWAPPAQAPTVPSWGCSCAWPWGSQPGEPH